MRILAESRRPKTKTAARKLDRAERLRRKAERLRRALEGGGGTQWRSFEDVLFVLKEIGALDKETLEPTALGNVARRIRGKARGSPASATPSLQTRGPDACPLHSCPRPPAAATTA